MKGLAKGFALAILIVYGGLWIITHHGVPGLSSISKFFADNFGIFILGIFVLQLLVCFIIITKNIITIKFFTDELEAKISIDTISKCITYLIMAAGADLLAYILFKLAFKFVNMVF